MSTRSRDIAVRHLNKGVSFIEKGLHADALHALELAEHSVKEAESPEIHASVLQTYADLLLSTGREDDAFERYRLAVDISNELLVKGYVNYEQRAGIFSNLAGILEKKGSKEEARKNYDISIHAYDKLLGSDSNNMTYRSNAASTLNNLGALLAEEGEEEAAQKSFEKALRILRESPEEAGRATTLQFKMATILENLLNLETGSSPGDLSEEKYRQLVDTYHRIIEMDPTALYVARLAFALKGYADVLMSAGKTIDAEALYAEAQAIEERLAEERKDDSAANAAGAPSENINHEPFAESKEPESGREKLINSLQSLRELLEKDPENPEYRSGIISVLRELNDLVDQEESSPEKLRDHELILTTCELLQDIDPSNMSYRLNVAFALDIRGKLLKELHEESMAMQDLILASDIALEALGSEASDEMFQSGARSIIDDLRHFAEGIDEGQEKIRVCEMILERLTRLGEIMPDDAGIKKDIAGLQDETGKLMLGMEMHTEAAEHFEKAAAMYELLMSVEDSNEEYMDKLVSALEAVGIVRIGLKEKDKALEIYFRLCGMEPSVKSHRDKVDSILMNMERDPLDASNGQALIAEYGKILAMREKLLAIEPDNLRYFQNIISLREEIANLMIDEGQVAEGLDIYLKLISGEGKNSQYRLKVTRMLENLKVSVPGIEDFEQRIKSYDMLLRLCEKLAEMDPGNAYIGKDSAAILENMALQLDENGYMDEARKYYESALSSYEELAAVDTLNLFYLERTASMRCKLGALLTDMGQVEEARGLFEASFMEYQTLLGEDSHHIGYQQNVAYILNNLGYFLLEEGELERAKPLYENALKRYAMILEEEPDNVSYRESAACTLNNLGYILENMGKEDDALWMYEKAKELIGN
jgi:tetratricopeptide (TPR) repeat protein